jgi:hypothetical protein
MRKRRLEEFKQLVGGLKGKVSDEMLQKADRILRAEHNLTALKDKTIDHYRRHQSEYYDNARQDMAADEVAFHDGSTPAGSDPST